MCYQLVDMIAIDKDLQISEFYPEYLRWKRVHNKKAIESLETKTCNYSEKVVAAITALKDRKGSSRQSILKYIVATYHVDKVHTSILVNTALKRGVKNGVLQQVTGTGANGSFKLKESKPVLKKSQKVASIKDNEGIMVQLKPIFNKSEQDSSTKIDTPLHISDNILDMKTRSKLRQPTSITPSSIDSKTDLSLEATLQPASHGISPIDLFENEQDSLRNYVGDTDSFNTFQNCIFGEDCPDPYHKHLSMISSRTISMLLG